MIYDPRSGTRPTGTWVEDAVLLPTDGQDDTDFGWSVALDGDTLAVGISVLLGPLGSVYADVKSGEVWVQQAKLPETPSGIFCWSVAQEGDTLLVGSYSGDEAHAYVRSGSEWTLQHHAHRQHVVAESKAVFTGRTRSLRLSSGATMTPMLTITASQARLTTARQSTTRTRRISTVMKPVTPVMPTLTTTASQMTQTSVTSGPLGAPVNSAGRPLGDDNEDCDLDLADYAAFHGCLSGPGNPPQGTTCRSVFNTDGDFDIDLVDFGSFQRFFTGVP